MTRIDLSPLYRSSVGFDRLASLLDSALNPEQQASNGFPPYNIEVTGENRYAITLALAGFDESELDIQTEKGVLTIRGRKANQEGTRQFLHQGIAFRSFERKFNLADHVEVASAELRHGLLTVRLIREIPEAAKPRKIAIGAGAAPAGKLPETVIDATPANQDAAA